MLNATSKRRPRGPVTVRVSEFTEWTDFHGLLELFGIRRSLAYHLIEEGVLKSVSLKTGDEKRGKRLFYVPSARQFLEKQMQAQK